MKFNLPGEAMRAPQVFQIQFISDKDIPLLAAQHDFIKDTTCVVTYGENKYFTNACLPSKEVIGTCIVITNKGRFFGKVRGYEDKKMFLSADTGFVGIPLNTIIYVFAVEATCFMPVK